MRVWEVVEKEGVWFRKSLIFDEDFCFNFIWFFSCEDRGRSNVLRCFKGISNKFIYSIYVYYGRVFLGLVNIFWLFRF